VFCESVPEFQQPRLIDRGEPLAGESWSDYLIRLSEANYIPGGLGAMARLAGMTTQQLVVASPAEVLGRFGIVYPSAPFEHPLDAKVDRERVFFATFGRTLKTRICPRCLASDKIPFVRAEWGMPMSVACSRHGTLLVDTCQSCHKPLDVLRPQLLHCRCGADLRQQKSDVAERWTEKLQEVFSEAYAAQTFGTFARAHELGQEAARTCKWLAAPMEPKTQRRSYAVLDRDGFLTISDALSIRHLLIDVPRNIVASVIAEADPGKRDGFMRLNYRLGCKFFSCMQSVAEEVKRLHQPELNPDRIRAQRRSLPPVKETYGIKDLMKVTGNSYGTLLRCIDEGGIPEASYTVDLATGAKKFNIPPAVYRSIVQAMQQTDTIEAGAAQLGCSVDAMRGLVASGCVAARKLALTRFGRNRDRVCPAELRSFADFLFREAKTENGPHLERLYFSWWVPGAYNAYRCKWWRKILGAVKEKRIVLFKAALVPVALNDLYVLRSDLRNLLGARCVQ